MNFALMGQMFWEFMKIGLFAVGGGPATLPYLMDLTKKFDWYTMEDLTNMIAISESTPGPLGLNMATYAGFHTLGTFGGVVSTLGLVIPSVIVIVLVAKFLENFNENKYVQGAFDCGGSLQCMPGFSLCGNTGWICAGGENNDPVCHCVWAAPGEKAAEISSGCVDSGGGCDWHSVPFLRNEKEKKYMENIQARCVLICAGDLEISEIPIRENDLVIAVDGGYMYCQLFAIEPDVVIGDFDSLEENSVRQMELAAKEENGGKKRIIRLDPMKDDTDTLAALKFGLEQGHREFHLYGALGGRLEHTMANLQCLLFLKRVGAAGYIWDGNTMTTVIQNETLSFRKEMEGMLSVFAVGGKAEGVVEKGLKYLLDDAVLDENFPVGISNEFIGEKAELTVKNGSLLVILRWD